MKRALAFLVGFCLIGSAYAGFKVKLIKPKKPEQFQTFLTVGEVTYAADVLIDEGIQKEYFYKGLTPSHVIAVRLAVFNRGGRGMVLPLDRLQLTDSAGKEIAPVPPAAVAQAVLEGSVVTAKIEDKKPVQVSPGQRDPRLDPTDPRYDPRYDPRDPRYDPRLDPNDPRYDPRYDPGDPRNDPTDPRYRRNPNGTYGPWYRPGIDVVLNPGAGGGSGDLSQFEKALVEKDFADKAHSLDPIDPVSTRDRFLYFSVAEKPANTKGFTLKLPQPNGEGQDIVLKF
jgi:hypothetical protein